MMTKEEIKEVMEEMECWSCDNHLNICDKHSDVEHKDEEYKQELNWSCEEDSLWVLEGRRCPVCNISKDEQLDTSKKCNHPGEDLCNECADTPTPPSKECEHGSPACEKACHVEFDPGITKSNRITNPENKAKWCRHEWYQMGLVCTKCNKAKSKDTPPCKIDPCKDCGAKKPKFCTCKQPLRVSQTTRLEKIRNRLDNAATSPTPMTDADYLVTKLDTAVRAFEIIEGKAGLWGESSLKSIIKTANSALKSINED